MFSSDQEPPKNLKPSEFKDFRPSSKNKKIVIQKADKSNTVR